MRRLAGFSAIPFIALLSGCHTHPIPHDVVNLEVHTIINHIRCEAKRTVVDIFEGRRSKDGLYRGKRLKDKEGDYRTRIKEIERADNYLATVRNQAHQINDRRADLLSRIALNNLRREKADLEIRNKDYDPNQTPIEEALVQRANALRQLDDVHRKEEISIQKAATRLKIDVLASNARIKYHERENVYKLRNLRNDDYDELHEFHRYFLAFQLQLKSSEKNTAKANATFKIPIPLGSITIDQINPAEERTREADRNVRIAASFGELMKLENCAGNPGNGLPLRYPIEGNVGLDEVIVQYMKIVLDKEKFTLKAAKDGDTYSDKITFKTTISGGANPKVSINHASGHTFTGGIDLSGSRTEEHILHIIFTKGEKEDKNDNGKATKVEIVRGSIKIEKESEF
jgi:hypothetical protein